MSVNSPSYCSSSAVRTLNVGIHQVRSNVDVNQGSLKETVSVKVGPHPIYDVFLVRLDIRLYGYMCGIQAYLRSIFIENTEN